MSREPRYRSHRKHVGRPALGSRARATRGPALLAAILLGLAAVPAAAATLAEILAGMDAASAGWNGMRARVRWISYMALVDDRNVESGTVAVRRAKSGQISMLLAFREPSTYFLSIRGAKVERYKPRTGIVEEFDLSESRDKLENALMIGFGTSGSYLGKHYEIALGGEEDVAGEKAFKLDLNPRNPGGDLNNQRLWMWVSPEHWQPVQVQIFDRHSKDYRLYSYTRIEINPSFKSDEFRLRLARGTRRVYPQR